MARPFIAASTLALTMSILVARALNWAAKILTQAATVLIPKVGSSDEVLEYLSLMIPRWMTLVRSLARLTQSKEKWGWGEGASRPCVDPIDYLCMVSPWRGIILGALWWRGCALSGYTDEGEDEVGEVWPLLPLVLGHIVFAREKRKTLESVTLPGWRQRWSENEGEIETQRGVGHSGWQEWETLSLVILIKSNSGLVSSLFSKAGLSQNRICRGGFLILMRSPLKIGLYWGAILGFCLKENEMSP